MNERRLDITFRRVPLEERGAHDRIWRPVRQAAEASGAHAWRFTFEDDAELVVEFLEYPASADLPGMPRVAEARADLARRFHAAPGVPSSGRWRPLD